MADEPTRSTDIPERQRDCLYCEWMRASLFFVDGEPGLIQHTTSCDVMGRRFDAVERAIEDAQRYSHASSEVRSALADLRRAAADVIDVWYREARGESEEARRAWRVRDFGEAS